MSMIKILKTEIQLRDSGDVQINFHSKIPQKQKVTHRDSFYHLNVNVNILIK